MTTTGKILGQAKPSSANTDVTLYTVPGATQAQCSKLFITNVGAADAAATVWLRVNGAAKVDAQIVVFPGVTGSVPVGQRQTLNDAWTLNAGDVVTIQSDTANGLSFTLMGLEIA